MIKLTPQMRQVLRRQPVVLVATTDGSGQLNVSPKIAFPAVSDSILVFADLCSTTTWTNLRVNPGAVVATVLPDTHEGYQFKGRAEMLREGPLFEDLLRVLAHCSEGPRPMELPFEKAARETLDARARAGRPGKLPAYVVVLHVDEIQNLTPGHETEVWR